MGRALLLLWIPSPGDAATVSVLGGLLLLLPLPPTECALFLVGPGLKPATASKPVPGLPENFVLPELPSVPDTLPAASAGAGTSTSEDIDFDDLSRRFEELKKKT